MSVSYANFDFMILHFRYSRSFSRDGYLGGKLRGLWDQMHFHLFRTLCLFLRQLSHNPSLNIPNKSPTEAEFGFSLDYSFKYWIEGRFILWAVSIINLPPSRVEQMETNSIDKLDDDRHYTLVVKLKAQVDNEEIGWSRGGLLLLRRRGDEFKNKNDHSRTMRKKCQNIDCVSCTQQPHLYPIKWWIALQFQV